MNLDALYKLAERFDFKGSDELKLDAILKSRLDPRVRSPSPERAADFNKSWGRAPVPVAPYVRAPQLAGLRRWGGRATRWGLLGGGALAAGNYLWGKVPDRFTVTPEEAAAQRRPGGAPSKPPEARTGQPAGAAAAGSVAATPQEAGFADYLSSGWDTVKDTWSDLPTAAKWGIGATSTGLATYLLYRLLRDNSDDR